MTASITRQIRIDAGHRVPQHASKCCFPHGHSYTIEATCVASVHSEGEQKDMVMDFGFLKEDMMSVIDAHCDHGLILWIDDPMVRMYLSAQVLARARETIQRDQYFFIQTSPEVGVPVKLYLIPSTPTAEYLAEHWFYRLSLAIQASQGRDILRSVKVWETPNCFAVYPAQEA